MEKKVEKEVKYLEKKALEELRKIWKKVLEHQTDEICQIRKKHPNLSFW